MTMAWTDFGCRAIAHPFLPFVFALGLGPTVVRRALLRPRAEVGVRKAA
jgi:hypothetical protein